MAVLLQITLKPWVFRLNFCYNLKCQLHIMPVLNIVYNSEISFCVSYCVHCSLILSGLDLGLPQHQVSLVTSHALSLVTNHLMTKEEEEEKGSGCGGVVRRRLDLSSHHQLSSLLRSLLTSKTAATQLTNSEVDHLTRLLLRVSHRILLCVESNCITLFSVGCTVVCR